MPLPMNKSLPQANNRRDRKFDNGPRGGPVGDKDKDHDKGRDRDRKGKGRDRKRGGRGGRGGGGHYGGGVDGKGGYRGVNIRELNRLLDSILNQQIRGIAGERRVVERDFRNERQDVWSDYKNARGDMNYVYGETNDYLGALRGQQRNQSKQAIQGMQASNAALQKQLGNTYSGAAQGAGDEMARLGIAGGGDIGGIAQDQAFSQATAQQAGANAVGTARQAQANNSGALAMIQGMNQGSFQSGMGRILNTRQDDISDLRQGRNDAMAEIRDAIQDVRGSRPDLFFQLLNQLQETGWGQYMDAQQLRMQRRELNHRLKKKKK